MSKHRKRGQFAQTPQVPQPSPGGGQPAVASPVTEKSAPAESFGQAPGGEAAGPDISAPAVPKTYFFIFWGLIVVTVAAAWTLEVLMPNVRESVIERWLMLAFAGALGVLLLIYK